MRSKYKEVISENKERWQLFKKNKKKQLARYYRDITVKMGDVNLYERYIYTR